MLVATLFPIHLPVVVKMAMMEGLIFSDPFLKMGTAVDSPQLSGTSSSISRTHTFRCPHLETNSDIPAEN